MLLSIVWQTAAHFLLSQMWLILFEHRVSFGGFFSVGFFYFSIRFLILRTDDLYVVHAQNCVGHSFEGPVCTERGKACGRVLEASSISGSEDNMNWDLHFFSSWEDLVDEKSFFSLYFSHICLNVLSIKMKYRQIWSDLGFFSAVFSTVNTTNKTLLL